MSLLFQRHIRFRAALADPLLLPWGVAFFTSIFTSWRLGRGGQPSLRASETS